MSYPPMATDFDKYEFLTRRFLLPSKETPMEFSPPNAITSAHQKESKERALSQLWGQRPMYVQDRMKALDSTKHRMGGLIVRTKQDREAANELLRNREEFFREQEDRKPASSYKTPTSFMIEGQLDDLTDQLFSEIASGVISTNTMATASNLRTFILGNGSQISMQKLVDVRNLIEGALSDVRMEGAIDSKMKVILDAVLKSLVKTKEILEKLIGLHQQGLTRQSYDQIIRALRNDQALESRNKLKDFQSITKARMKAMDKRRGQSTRFSATDSSSSLGYGPGDDDEDDDDDDEEGDDFDAGGVDEEEGGDEGGEGAEEEEGEDEGKEVPPTSFPAAQLDSAGARGALSPLFLAASASEYPLFEPPPSRGAPKPKARNRLSFPWNWLSGAPQASSEASVVTASKRPELKQRKKQQPGRLDVNAAPLLTDFAPPRRNLDAIAGLDSSRRPFSPLSADRLALARDLAARGAPQSAQRAALANALAEEARQMGALAVAERLEEEAAASPYAPSASSIADYTRKKRKQNWNAFLERNAGRGLSMDELRRRYQMIQAAAEAAAR
jgi:hypothetical protein